MLCQYHETCMYGKANQINKGCVKYCFSQWTLHRQLLSWSWLPKHHYCKTRPCFKAEIYQKWQHIQLMHTGNYINSYLVIFLWLKRNYMEITGVSCQMKGMSYLSLYFLQLELFRNDSPLLVKTSQSLAIFTSFCIVIVLYSAVSEPWCLFTPDTLIQMQ